MPWCQNCKVEYREGFIVCNDCNTELIDALEKADEDYTYANSLFLISVSDDYEASIIESILNQYSIPILRKHKETGSYLNIATGRNPFGVDLYVPSVLYDNAKEIIQGYMQDEINTEEEIIDSKLFVKKRRVKAWIIMFIFTPGFIWLCLAIINAIYEMM